MFNVVCLGSGFSALGSDKDSIGSLKEILYKKDGNIIEGINTMISEMKRNDVSDKLLPDENPETEVHIQRFENTLLTLFPELTKLEIELCSLIRLQLSNKEIAMHRGINTSSVKVAKRRLKRKLKLDITQSLSTFILSLDRKSENIGLSKVV